MRFRILDLLGAISIFGFVCAALVRADAMFECLFFSFTLLVLLMSALLAIGQAGASRAFWLGFAVAGTSYLVFAHFPDANGTVPRHDGPEFTTQLLRLAFNHLHAGDYDTALSPASVDTFPAYNASSDDMIPTTGSNLSLVISGGQQIISDGTSLSFMRIGHSAWALLLAWIAAHFTKFIYLRSRGQLSKRHTVEV